MSETTPSKPDRLPADTPSEPTIQQRKTLAGVILAGLMIMMAWWGVRGLERDDHTPAPALWAGVNPNTAAWYELAQLPGLGESAGRAIVAYREAQLKVKPPPVFKIATDLEPVPGIVQRTIERIAKYLDFGAGAPSAGQSATSQLAPH